MGKQYYQHLDSEQVFQILTLRAQEAVVIKVIKFCVSTDETTAVLGLFLH